jgi:peptide/nickel transport system permease protein
MGSIVLRRVAVLIPVLFIVTIAAFLLQLALPGDAAYALAGNNPTAEQIAHLRADMHLDQAWPVRYWYWLDGVFHGNLGTSYTSHQSVASELAHRMPITASLTVASLLLILLIGIPLGIFQGLHPGTKRDKSLLAGMSLAISAPGFWVATMLVFVFAVQLKWLPALGYVSLGQSPSSWLSHIILPAFTLALAGFAIIARFLRTGIVGEQQEPYVRALHARGLSAARVNYKHVLKNAALPTVTVLGLNVGYLLSGAVIVEQIFTLPGMGSYALQAIQSRNAPAIQGVILATAVVIMAVNLLTDLAYSALNPKVRLS